MNLALKKESLIKQYEEITQEIHDKLEMKNKILGALELIEQLEEGEVDESK